jgi:pyridoxal phosphate enzyme (YggS family)
MELLEKYLTVKQTIPDSVTLVAVSKFKPAEVIRTLFDETGHCVFGESRAQELAAKYPQLPERIDWHFIGHLQTNKIKMILPFTGLIHSIDSYKLLKEVNREAARMNRVTNVLLQFHIATEETKFGLSIEEAREMLDDAEFASMANVCIRGVMGMASFSDDHTLVRKEFKKLKTIFDGLQRDFFQSSAGFTEVSMGMSGDYELAIDEGSTMVRVGSLIFGER